MEPQGWVILGTKMDNKQLTKDLKQQEQILKEHEKKANELLVYKEGSEKRIDYLKKQIKEAEEFEEKYKKLNEEYDKLRIKMDEIYSADTEEGVQRNLELNAETVNRYSEVVSQLNAMSKKKAEEGYSSERINEELEKEKETLKVVNNELKQNLEAQDQISNNIDRINSKMQLNDINVSINKISKSITSVIKKVGRWALAIFGIRGAYMAVRNAINVISQGDEQLKADIDYMKKIFAYALEPVVRRIIDLAKQLLYYIAYIIKLWFKYDIFKNANEKIAKTNDGVKELKKQLAGFDEMNILSDSGGAGGGISANMNLDDFNAPKWLEWIGNNKDKFLAILSAITGALIALKLAGLNPVLAVLGAILGLEIYDFIKNIVAMIKDPSWLNFAGILESLGVIIATIAGILMVLGVASGPIGWIIIGVGLLISGIGDLIKKIFKNKSAIKDLEQANKDLKKAKDNLYNATEDYTQAVKNEEQAHKDLIEAQKETGLSGEELYNLVDSGKATYKDFNEQQRKVYDAYVNEQKAIGNVKDAEEKLTEAKKEETQASIESELANAKETDSYDKLKESIIKAFRDGKISAGEARDYLSRAMADMSTDSKKTFMQDIPNDIKAGLDPHQYDSFATKFKNWWNKLIKGLDTTIEITGVAKGGGGSGSSGGGYQEYIPRAKGGIFYPSKLPKLGIGGIINQPGRGIPYHGATIGERGAEAVVPLTDSQQMALLGEAIGKYININATVPVYVGNRMVARELKRINAEDNFATNR